MLTTETKNAVLSTLGELIDQERAAIIDANREDVRGYSGGDEAMMDRLMVNTKKVNGMITAVQAAVELEDPEGRLLYSHQHANGMRIENRTVAFGRILIIYESRPDVTIEAAITAFKAGNRIFLKGGKEAKHTNLLLTGLWHRALDQHAVSRGWVTYLDVSRTAIQAAIKSNSYDVDLIIPRGGEQLIRFVTDNTDIPVIVSGRGNNFLFVDRKVDFEMAVRLILDGKKRISVCNALDKVLIDRHLPDFEAGVSRLAQALARAGIDVLGDQLTAAVSPAVELEEDPAIYDEEFLAPRIFLAGVDTLDVAVDIINRHSGKHSATIVTTDPERAQLFMEAVDSAAVYHNASTRFTDGGQFGFGAEMAISTQKLHFRGPVAINQLVTNKWMIYGNGQSRG